MRATKEADEKSGQRESRADSSSICWLSQGTQFTAGGQDSSSNGRISISSLYYLQI